MKPQEIDLHIGRFTTEFIDICPHCGTKAHLQRDYNEHYTTRNGDQYNYIIFRCVPCGSLSLQVFQSEYRSASKSLKPGGWAGRYPNKNSTPQQKYTDYVPSAVLADYTEGLVCISAGAHRGAVSMFRRAIQNALLERGADQKLDLIKQINAVDGLTKDIKDWAHNVRIFGNWGAHPQDDLLKDVTPELAQEVRELLEEFMNYVYIMPGKVVAARKRYEKKEEDKK